MAFVKVVLTGTKDLLKAGFERFNTLIDDLVSTSSGKGASQIGVEDSAGNLDADNVEDAIAEIYTDTATTMSLAETFNENPDATTGLTWGYKAGVIRYDNEITSVSANTVSLTDDATNYIEVRWDGKIIRNIVGFTAGRIPIRQVVTEDSVQITSTDKRGWFGAQLVPLPINKGGTGEITGRSMNVQPVDVLSASMTRFDSDTLTIEGNETFAVGDILRMVSRVDDEWLEVMDADDAPTYTVTRDKADAYGADSNPDWQKGTSVNNYQKSGDGGVFLTSDATNAPYISVFSHAGEPWDTLSTKVRLGNLNRFLGYETDEYGIAIGETEKYLKYDPTNGLRIKGTITGSNIILDTDGYIKTTGKDNYSDATAGFFLGYDTDVYKFNLGNDTQYIKWDGTNLTIEGGISVNTITLDTDGYIRTIGKDNYADTTAGFFFGYDTGAYKLNIGDTDNYLKWDGAILNVKGLVSVDALSAINADLGTCTAGIVKSSDDKIILDLNNKWLKVYDAQETPVLRVHLGYIP